MRAKQLLFTVTVTSMVVLLLACTSGETNARDESSDAHVDQVPGALERMKRWPGLGDAVTEVVMNSPRGRIHGHDARRIDIEVDDEEGTAEVLFVLPASFELHGDRRVACVNKDGRWRCTDETYPSV